MPPTESRNNESNKLVNTQLSSFEQNYKEYPDATYQSRKLLLIAGIVVVVVLLLISVTVLWNTYHFGVDDIDPAISEMNIWQPQLNVSFNQNLSLNGISISMSPNSLFKNPYTIYGKTLSIYFKVPLDQNTTYTVTINRIEDTKRQLISNIKYTFKPAYIKRSGVTDDEEEDALEGRNQSSPAYQDPILSHLPYDTVDFDLSPSFGLASNGMATLTLKAQLFIHAAQSGNESAATAQDKQEVQSYIQSIGLNPNKYTIQYTVVSPP